MRLAKRARSGRLALAVLTACAAAPLPVPPAARAALLVLALGLTPGLLLAPRLTPGVSHAHRALLALALSPFLAAAPASALVAAGLPLALAAQLVIAAFALWAAVAAFARESPAARVDVAPAFGAAALWTALVAALLIGNPDLPPRSDGWFHAAATLQIAARGLPPEDPAFAGLPLLYFWGTHLWAAMWLALEPRLAPWTPLIALNLAAAFATLLGVCELARRLGATARGQWLAAGIATLGYAPFGWGLVAARAATGEVRGLPEVARLITLGVDPALRALSTGTLHPSLAFFGDKFLVLTPFSLGLALFAAFTLALLDLAQRPGARTAVALGVIEAAALFVHTVVGFTAAMIAAAWWVVTLIGARHPERAGPRRALLPAALALAGATLAVAPYLLAVASPRHAPPAGGFSQRALVSWLAAGALLVPAGLFGLASAARRPGAGRDLLVLVLALTALALGLRLTENNQSKFFNLLFLLLAPAAAMAWLAWLERARGMARALLVALLAIAALPTAGLALWGFACERGQSEEASHRPRPEARAVWAWAREHTPSDAVFVDAGGGSDMLVLAGRSALWGGGAIERDWGHPAPALALRRRASRELGAGGPLDSEVRGLLSELGREIVVVTRAPAESAGIGATERFDPLVRGGGIALARWTGAR